MLRGEKRRGRVFLVCRLGLYLNVGLDTVLLYYINATYLLVR